MALAADFHGLGLGEPLRGVGRAGARHRRPARPPRRARCPTRATSPRRTTTPSAWRSIGRPNVGKSTLVNRFLGDERVIVSDVAGHHARRDRHAARGRRAQADARRHRGHAPPVQGHGLGRVLHDAALAARGRARRRRARRLRRPRRRHQPGPAHRRAGDEGGLRHRARAQQVGHRRDGRGRPRPRARARGPEAAAAPAGAHRQRQDRAQRPAPAQRGDHRSATGCTTASRRRSSTASWPRSPRRASRRPSRATGSSCSTWPRSRRAPPRFSIQVNSRNRVTRDYAYFIENRLRARYGMDGVPLIIDFNERKPRRDARS